MLSDIDAEIKSLLLVIFYGWITGTIIGGALSVLLIAFGVL